MTVLSAISAESGETQLPWQPVPAKAIPNIHDAMALIRAYLNDDKPAVPEILAGAADGFGISTVLAYAIALLFTESGISRPDAEAILERLRRRLENLVLDLSAATAPAGGGLGDG